MLFLPVVFLLYHLVARTVNSRNTLLVVASYFFYGVCDWRLTLLLAFVTVVSYTCGLLIEHPKASATLKRTICSTNVVLMLAVLAWFKYFNFFAQSFTAMLNAIGLTASWTTLNIVLPVGISFYTFQAVSYVVDVMKQRIPAERNFVTYATYICFFPQLVAGPIERASNVLPQLHRLNGINYAQCVDGLRQMLWGFFKKLVVADNCALVVDMVFKDYTLFTQQTLIYALLLFGMQLYCDFSAYSDIAIGTARLFGISLKKNFNNPYFATSVQDYWRRWHISLTSWFRDYVYIPLGGSRDGLCKTMRNVMIVFVLSGLWHGANYTYTVWGAYCALLMLPSVVFNGSPLMMLRPKWLGNVLSRVYTLVMVVGVGFLIFRSETLTDAWGYFSLMMCGTDASLAPSINLVLCSFIAITLGVEYITRNCTHAFQIDAFVGNGLARKAIYIAIYVAIFWQMKSSGQFIYFQF